MKKISIIIPTLNSAGTIERCVKSLNGLYKTDVELLFIDGGSTDGTVNLIKEIIHEEIFSRVIILPGSGIYSAMNEGVRQASGQYLMFLGSDDEIIPEQLNLIALKEFNSAYLIVASVKSVNKFGVEVIYRYTKEQTFVRFSRGRLRTPHHQAVIYNKKYFQKFGDFDERYRICADAEHLLRSRQSTNQIAYVNAVISKFYCGGVSSNFLEVWGENLIMSSKDKSINRGIFLMDSVFTAIRYISSKS
jgi:glycosyltransferase involved in cell wall biosynthesis